MNKGLILPFKRYEIGKVFRDGPVKLGRAREFYQCDVDACGTESPYAEIEYFMMNKEVFSKLNIDIEIRYNNRKFLSGILEYAGVKKENINSFIISVDKLDKISREDIEKELLNHTEKEVIDKVFSLFNKNLEELNKELNEILNDKLIDGLKELNELDVLIKDLDLSDVCVFTPFLARGLDIYTGTVWEVFDKTLNFKSALGGGGRYDKIITNFLNDGNEYPAIGCSFGLEPIYEILKEREKDNLKKYDIYVYEFNNDANLFKISDLLRKNGYKVLTELNRIKLKKAMNIANRENIDKVIIIGEDELKDNSVMIKNMITGNQEKVKINEIINKIEQI
jgi:histidyl-tRNA synthetase